MIMQEQHFATNGPRRIARGNAPSASSLSGELDDMIECWVDLHRRRQELLALLPEEGRNGAPVAARAGFHLRQSANRLFFEIQQLDEAIAGARERYARFLASGDGRRGLALRPLSHRGNLNAIPAGITSDPILE